MTIRSLLLCFLLSIQSVSALAAADDTSPQADGDTVAETTDAVETEIPLVPKVVLPRVEPNPELNRLLDLVKSSSPETEVLWLETAEDRTMALFHPQGKAEPLGGIILFPDHGTHADWPDTIRPLRLHLTDQGWHTLSLQLPTPPPITIPKRTLPVLKLVQTPPPAEEGDTEDAAPDAETAPPAAAVTETPPPAQTEPPEPIAPALPARAPYPERLRLLAESALIQLKQREAEVIVVLGVGSGAIWAAQFAQEHQDTESMLGLVMIDPIQPVSEIAPTLAEVIPELKVPVVDIFQNLPGSRTDFEDESKQRMRWAKRHKLPSYYQRRITNTHLSWEKKEAWLRQQVTGLLRRHIIEKLGASPQKDAKKAVTPSQELAPGRAIQTPEPI